MESSTVTRSHGMALKLKKHQRTAVTPDPHGHVFLISSGVLLAEIRLPAPERQILEIMYPGDVFQTQDAPAGSTTTLVAVVAAEVQRLRSDVLDSLERADPEFARYLAAALAHRNARKTLRLASLSSPASEERLADFLVETGLHLGEVHGLGRSFPIALTRDEIADYLALNPDTLSRTQSRLKARGLLSITSGRATVPDWQALCALSPISSALTEAYQRAPRLPG